jgi:hypothetical protein
LPIHAISLWGELEHAAPDLGEGSAESEQLVLGRERARHCFSVDGLVQDRSRRRHADRAGLDGFTHDRGHRLDVVGRRGLVASATLAHHIGADRAVWCERGDIESEGGRADSVEVFGKGLPAPADPLVQCRPGDVFDTLHQPDQPLTLVGHHWCEADTAVAEHQRGDAVPAARRQGRVPGHLAVVVGVDVDEAGCDDVAGRIDLLESGDIDRADGRDHAAVDGNIRVPGRATSSIDHKAATNHQIMHCRSPFNRGSP